MQMIQFVSRYHRKDRRAATQYIYSTVQSSSQVHMTTMDTTTLPKGVKATSAGWFLWENRFLMGK